MKPTHPTTRFLLIATIALVLSGAGGCGNDSGPSATTGETDTGVATYRLYLLVNAEKLTTWATQLRNKFKQDLLGGAQSRFASSQVPLGHLRPALALFPQRNRQLIDPTTGAFPRIERLLWKQASTSRAGMTETSEALDAILLLHEQLKTVPLPPVRILGLSEGALEEIATVDLRLQATPYAHIDLIQASADLEGVEAAYAALRPVAKAEDPDLAHEINTEFKASFAGLEEFGPPAHNLAQPRPSSPGTAFLSTENGQVKRQDLQSIAAPVAELEALFGRLRLAVEDSG